MKVIYDIVHIQIAIPDDIILDPSGGNKRWSRKESVRDRHISRFQRGRGYIKLQTVSKQG